MKKRRRGILNSQKRFLEELRNVHVDCWVYAARKENDHDIHLIIGNSPRRARRVLMTAEVSGLPRVGKDIVPLRRARRQLVRTIGRVPTDYRCLVPPLHVSVQGSLLFDAHHRPEGTEKCGLQLDTVWEIHPVTRISSRDLRS